MLKTYTQQQQDDLLQSVREYIRSIRRHDKPYHRSSQHPRTPPKLTKKERKALAGPNLQTKRSMSCEHTIQTLDGAVYRGQDAGFMQVGKGLGLQKIQPGIPYVKVM